MAFILFYKENIMEEDKNILIVDDDEINLTVLHKLLSRLGYNVTMVNNAKQAIKIIKRLSFDIIFFDYNLPTKTGLDIYNETKEWLKHTKVILFTGYEIDDIDGLPSEIHYMQKPVDVRELKQIII